MNQKPHRKFVILKKAHMAGPVTFHNLENVISAISASPPVINSVPLINVT